MASSRASTSRLSLEDWDSLSPLTPLGTASVHRLERHVNRAERPDVKRVASLAALSRSGSPTPSSSNPSRLAQPPVNLAEADTTTTTRRDASLDLAHPIETMQHFHDWFTHVEHSIEHSQEQVYRHHLAVLARHLATCSHVLERLDESRGLLSEMEANYRYVEDNSRALQLACETMLDEQHHLVEVTDAIGARLEYFRELEGATRMLNLPGEDLVLQEDFLNMIDRLDVCLDYLKANRDFRDAEIYLIRFQQCLTRAMTLIKMYFVSTIRKITLDTAEKMMGKELSDTALQALLYQKFEAPASSLRILLVELEKRASSDPSEYDALRHECFQVWFTARTQLLSPGLAEEVRRMEPDKSDLIRLAKAGCNHLRSVCMNEWRLYKMYFSTGEDDVYQFLENLCDHLYDSLRPRILHEPRLDALCELCTVLGAMMALDADTGLVEASDDDDDDDDLFSSNNGGRGRGGYDDDDGDDDDNESIVDHGNSASFDSGHGSLLGMPETAGQRAMMMTRQSSTQTLRPGNSRSNSDSKRGTRGGQGGGGGGGGGGGEGGGPLRLGRLRFSVLLRTILQDTQTRLVFRAQAVIQSEVLHYVPTASDLNYPKILEDKALESGKEPLWVLEDAEGTNDETPSLGSSVSSGCGTGSRATTDRDRDKDKRFRVPNESHMKWWYPTLRRTVWVLARLNTFVNNAIFEDFAGEAVTLCQQSLLSAATQISSRSAPRSLSDSKKNAPGLLTTTGPSDDTAEIDGQLFLVRHLLLLKETVRSVDLVHIERAADFSTVTDMLSQILRNTSAIFNPAALFELASKGIPNFAETMFDAKTDLDAALKRACQDLITTSALRLTVTLQTFLDRCTAFLSSSSSASASRTPQPNRDLPSQDWATPERVLEIHDEFQRAVEQDVRDVSAKMRLYLEEEKTVAVLLPPLLEEIVETYTTFFNLTRSEYGFATSSSLLPPADVKEKVEKASRYL
ncbi:hypothetical protein JCM10212_001908 [Sporobolomyces blumeae]